MRLSLWAGVASLATMLCVGSTNAVAQERQGGRPDFNSDEFRQRMMDGIRAQHPELAATFQFVDYNRYYWSRAESEARQRRKERELDEKYK